MDVDVDIDSCFWVAVTWMLFVDLVSRLSNGPYGAAYGLL